MNPRRNNPWARSAVSLAVVVLLLLVFLGLRTLNAMGVFTRISPHFAGVCRAVTGVKGAGDLQIDAPDGLVFVSARNRHDKMPDPRDGIYTMKLGGAPLLTRLEGAPKNFHPSGISLLRGPGNGLTLMAINNYGHGSYSVEIFSVTVTDGVAKLNLRTTVASGLLIHPKDIAAVTPAAFYLTNDSTVKNRTLRGFTNYTLLRRGNVVYFDGNTMRPVARGLDFANGIALSPHSDYVYVAVSFGRALVTYVRQPITGALSDPQTLALPTRPGNLNVDAQGNVWVAGQPRLGVHPSASQVFKVTVKDAIPQSAQAIYVNDGSQIGGSSTGAVLGKRLFIGAGGDTKILDCRMQ